MPIYLSPGVYVEEVPGTPPIAGVGTSTAGFLGIVADNVKMPEQPGVFEFEKDASGNVVKDTDGVPKLKKDASGNVIPVPFTVAPAGEPQLITNWEQFKSKFGDFQAGNSTLAHAVYVSRVTTLNTTNATNALKKFEAIDEIAIVAAPGATDAGVQGAVVSHCENMKDRFAIIDGQQTTTMTVAAIKGTVGNSNFAALYFPWLKVADPITNQNISVPPGGHLAGIYSRVDQERGVHKAPANEVVRGALGLEYRVSKNEQDLLNPKGINIIRDINGGIRVWGARTLGGDANGEFKYINVRRLMNFLRESIDEGTQFVVFEPNNAKLWEKIKRTVGAFLTAVWRDGALFGNTPEQAFYVKCDETTNPPPVRELGQVVTEIGVAIVKPAEFVIFRITQLTGLEG
jgi:uncharacterized protein